MQKNRYWNQGIGISGQKSEVRKIRKAEGYKGLKSYADFTGTIIVNHNRPEPATLTADKRVGGKG